MGFKQLADFCEECVKPVANQLDEDSVLLKKIFQQLNEHAWLGLCVPKSLGGRGGDESDVKAFYSLMAQYSGALLLVYAQHHMAVRWVVERFPDSPLRTRTLNNIIEKKRSLGISFAPLKGTLVAHQVADKGVQLTGKLPWVTGFQMHQQIVVAFRVVETVHYMLLPFVADTGVSIEPGQPLAVFNGTATVSMTLKDFRVPPCSVFHSHHNSMRHPFPHPARYALLGEARALLAIMANSRAMSDEACQQCHQQLSDAVAVLDKQLLEPETNPYAQRAEMLSLALQCAQAALSAVGGRAILADHPVQRHYREIMQFAVAGLNDMQQEAYFKYSLKSINAAK